MLRTVSIFLFVVCFAPLIRAADIQVLAAASLSDALQEIAPDYEKASGDTLRFSFAGSNALARQIREGAPADVFLSADDAQMDTLEKAGLIVGTTRRRILSNVLAIVVGTDSPVKVNSAHDLAQPSIKRLALADPKAVPAGVYAREYLTRLGLWQTLAPRVVPTENVRAALAAVEAGNAQAGIVYRTDAGISKNVRIAFVVPVEEGPKISYPAAVVTASKNSGAAEKFVAYLQSEPARKVFRKFGFLIPE